MNIKSIDYQPITLQNLLTAAKPKDCSQAYIVQNNAYLHSYVCLFLSYDMCVTMQIRGPNFKIGIHTLTVQSAIDLMPVIRSKWIPFRVSSILYTLLAKNRNLKVSLKIKA